MGRRAAQLRVDRGDLTPDALLALIAETPAAGASRVNPGLTKEQALGILRRAVEAWKRRGRSLELRKPRWSGRGTVGSGWRTIAVNVLRECGPPGTGEP
jgi:hypothetical protein